MHLLLGRNKCNKIKNEGAKTERHGPFVCPEFYCNDGTDVSEEPMTTKDQTRSRQETVLRLRAQRRPEVDLDKLALALLNLVRDGAKHPPQQERRRG